MLKKLPDRHVYDDGDKRGMLPQIRRDFETGIMTDIKNFETSMKELEEIVERLENGNMPLEDALKAFEKGVGLARHCSSLLDQAEKRVKMLTSDGSEEYLPENPQAG